MNWSIRYRLKSYVRSSLWIVPLAALVVEQVTTLCVRALDARLGWRGFHLGVTGARSIVESIVTLTLSFIVFTFGSLLVAIQVASGQYTPRIIATTLLRNNVIRYTVGLFVFTFVFAIRTLARTETTVPQLPVFVAVILGFVCITAFLFLIDYAARLLRPVSLVRYVGEAGLEVLDSVYPDRLVDSNDELQPVSDSGPITRTVFYRGSSRIVTAVDAPGLLASAEKVGGVIEFAPQVGDFVGKDEPLFLLHAGAAAIEDGTLRACVVFGPERTVEQDPLFALRILVDIAIKALSPAINDPTTAVLALDQLQRLLRRAGGRNLRTDYVCNSAGKLRVILRTPDWNDFVHLAFTEIRTYGAGNIQVARRLRAMVTNLTSTLPAARHAVLQVELDLLDRSLAALYRLPEDLALARIPDTQGLGGSAGCDGAVDGSRNVASASSR
jgi:uncharacterized membrane protein